MAARSADGQPPPTVITAGGGFELIRERLDILGQRFRSVPRGGWAGGRFRTRFAAPRGAHREGCTRISIVVEGAGLLARGEVRIRTGTATGRCGAADLRARPVAAFPPLQGGAVWPSAVATLRARRYGVLVKGLREGLRAGTESGLQRDPRMAARRCARWKYISENVYNATSRGSPRTSEINSNLDVSTSGTVRGGVASDGIRAWACSAERDY